MALNIKIILAALLATIVLALAAATAPTASAAGSPGVACNYLRYGGNPTSQVHMAQYFANPYFGAYGYAWSAAGTPPGFQVNTSGVYADGRAWCRGHWSAYDTNSGNGYQRPLACQYLAITSAVNTGTFYRWEQCYNT